MSDRPELAGLLGALVIAFSAILVRLADVAPSTAAFFRCAYAVPVPALSRGSSGAGTGRALGATACSRSPPGRSSRSIWSHGTTRSTRSAPAWRRSSPTCRWCWWRCSPGRTLGERPTSRTLVSIPIALFGVVLIGGVIGAGRLRRRPAAGRGLRPNDSHLVLALPADPAPSRQHRAVGGAAVCEPPAGPLFDATLSAAVCIAIGGVVIGDIDWVPNAEAQAWLVLLALSSQVLGWLLITLSLPRLPAALASIVLMVQPVAAMLLGAILLDESPSSVQLAGVAIVLAAVAFATLGGRSRQPLTQSA